MSLEPEDGVQATATEYDEDGFMTAQVDTAGIGDGGGCPYVTLHHPHGFSSRPLDPDPDGTGCNAFHAYEGDGQHVRLSYDPRVVPLLPALQKGESLQYGPAGNFVRCHADGGISRFSSSDGTVNGQSIFDKVSPKGYQFVSPFGTVDLDAISYRVRTASGALLSMGGINIPAFANLGSYAQLQAATVSLNASQVSLGAGVQQPVALAPYVLSALSAIQTLLAAFAAQLPALASTPAGATAAATIVAAITVAESAIAAAELTIPSLSTTSS